MDPGEHRQKALVLTIVIVMLLTCLIAIGVVHKINKKLVEPGILYSTPNQKTK